MKVEINNMRLKIILAVCLLLSPIGCKGPDGERGPIGLSGLMGEQGDPGAGTRIVYQGTVTSALFTVSVPEIDLSDMPSVSVFINDADAGFPSLWGEIGDIDSVPNPLTDPYASFSNGAVGIANALGNQYRIVVII